MNQIFAFFVKHTDSSSFTVAVPVMGKDRGSVTYAMENNSSWFISSSL